MNKKTLLHLAKTHGTPLFVIDHEGIIQQVNKASCQAFGWTEKEFIGKNISMIMPDGHADKHDNYLSHYLKTGFRKMSECYEKSRLPFQ